MANGASKVAIEQGYAFVKKAWQNPWVRYSLAFGIGYGVGGIGTITAPHSLISKGVFAGAATFVAKPRVRIEDVPITAKGGFVNKETGGDNIEGGGVGRGGVQKGVAQGAFSRATNEEHHMSVGDVQGGGALAFGRTVSITAGEHSAPCPKCGYVAASAETARPEDA